MMRVNLNEGDTLIRHLANPDALLPVISSSQPPHSTPEETRIPSRYQEIGYLPASVFCISGRYPQRREFLRKGGTVHRPHTPN